MDKFNFTDAQCRDAVLQTLDFFDSECSYSQLIDDLHAGTFQVLDMTVHGQIDGNKRLYNMAFVALRMAQILRPFAELIGQGDEMYYDFQKKSI